MEHIQIIRPTELSEMLGVSKQTLWRMYDELPPKVQISRRAVGWDKRDIDEWIQSRKESNAA